MIDLTVFVVVWYCWYAI